jgi:hypothetical protein
MKEFTNEVIDEIKYYVYRLIDPRNGNTFYVGKGKGNRIFQHMTGALKFEGDEDKISEKIDTIRNIQKSGLDIIHVIHRHGLDEENAKEVEAALIDIYPGLTNIAGGYGSSERGPMNAFEIQKAYGAELIDEITEKCIIIKINQGSINRFSKDEIYQATRASWKLKKSKAEKADYVLAVLNGIVKDVFTDMIWNDNKERNRLYFDGKCAPENIRKKYIGKRVPAEYRKFGSANPIQYVNI